MPGLNTTVRIGPYEVVTWLGAGGMGEVYRARDHRLERDVAIKLLPASLASDAARVRRFEQEARAAGQLNHPNIVAIYDVGVQAGTPYLVSELLDGESLGARLRSGRLPLAKAIDFARQAADGLAAAHDKGIVHRDIKPDNLFVTQDGRIKILDFGIAKLTRPGDDLGSADAYNQTDNGIIVGSAAYMSPEQVRGEPIDARSDLFSLGTTLYEMIAGREAFTHATAAETMTAILNDEPPALTAVPPALAKIVARCLEKTREARFQSARDLAFALGAITAPHSVAARERPQGTWRWLLVGAAAVAAAFAATTVPDWRRRPEPPSADALARATLSAVTDWPGVEAMASISPDGRFVTFLADRDGGFDIWINQLGTSEFRNLTPDLPSMNPPGIVLRPFGFSGDGSKIWFSLSGNPGDRKMLMPLLGGTPWPFLSDGDVTPSWSPDGGRVAFVNNRNGDPMFVADAAGSDARRILTPESHVLHNHDPVWSLDGRWIYFVRGAEPTDVMEIWRLPAAGGTPERLTTLESPINFLAPIDARTLAFVARARDRSGPSLWALDVETRAVRRVNWGLEQFTSIAASRDGRRVVATVARPASTLWSVPIVDRPAEDRDAERVPVTTVRAHGPRFAGGSLLYLSARGNANDIHRYADGASYETWQGIDGTLSEPPAISPDGRMMAALVSRQRKRQLTIVSIDGTNARTLAATLDLQGAAAQATLEWSADGGWLLAGGRDGDGAGLFKIPIGGGDPVRLTTGQATNPVRSPRDDLIVFTGAFVAGQATLQAIRADGTPVDLPVTPVRQGGYRFLPDGSGLVYLPGLQSRDFWLLDLATGHRRQLTNLGNRGRLETFDITPDGTRIVFDRLDDNSDIVLIDLASAN